MVENEKQPLSDDEIKQFLAESVQNHFERFYYAYERRLYYLALKFTRAQGYSEQLAEEDARDAVQQAMINIFYNLQGRSRENIMNLQLPAWTYSIIYHECLKCLSRRRTIPMSQLETPENSPFENLIADIGEEPETVYQQIECIDQVQQAILKLPKVYRDVAFLLYIEDLKLEEIAKRLKRPLGTVKSQVGRMKQYLRPILTALMKEEN
jgi:RNA polymerase sigma factor (sigma-70 family)